MRCGQVGFAAGTGCYVNIIHIIRSIFKAVRFCGLAVEGALLFSTERVKNIHT